MAKDGRRDEVEQIDKSRISADIARMPIDEFREYIASRRDNDNEGKGVQWTTDEMIAVLAKLKPIIQRGASLYRASVSIGFPYTTIRSWREKHAWVASEIADAESYIDFASENLITDTILAPQNAKAANRTIGFKEMKLAVETAKWRLETRLSSEYRRRQKIDTITEDEPNPFEHLDAQDLAVIDALMDKAQQKATEAKAASSENFTE